MSKGFVVDHKESGIRYAVSEQNVNDKIHDIVRPLNPGETVRGFQPKRKGDLTGQPVQPELDIEPAESEFTDLDTED
jgi:hypothetical protein